MTNLLPNSARPGSAKTFAGVLTVAATMLIVAPVAEIQFFSPSASAAAKNKTKYAKEKKSKSKKAKTAASIRALERARKRQVPVRKSNKSAHRTAPTVSHGAASKGDQIQPTLQDKKAAVLAAPPELLKQIGRHVIVGYHTAQQLTPLLDRGALGGVFVTKRNARHRTKFHLKKELYGFKKRASDAGQKAFWLATDQEGGSVSRLSPPLPYQRSLQRAISKLETSDERRAAVAAYATKQAKELAGLGINLNFAPVADVNHHTRTIHDRHTRIRRRAIAEDPDVITNVARTYCNALSKEKIRCTLKHFPGLGRAIHDTHITSARLKASRDELAKSDWIPFRQVLSDTNAFVMVGHQHVDSIDKERPASTSSRIIQKLLRDSWNYDGVVITDDLAMGAIARHYTGGVRQAAIDALNAGADLVLIGNGGEQAYEVLYALILAHEQKRLNREKLAASDARLLKAAKAIRPATNSARTTTSVPRETPQGKLSGGDKPSVSKDDHTPSKTARQ
ncbi:MAG: glycoside hydrolase family 3 protein [Hyphomicrobiaceae bacterium]|nr:glycoside hydrolase family 3 protein [Hyphomicrobiaceae bacterium]MCC0010663.1 glycoside hydrolase family 3 protein [Hyphomicrobiaceae bacterium]